MKEKKTIIDYFKRIYDRQLTTSTGGNISIRKHESMLVSPTGKDKGTLTVNDIAEVELTSGKSLSNNKPTCEVDMHRLIFIKRPDVNAIIHAHPVYSSLFSVIPTKIRLDLFSETFIFIPNINYVDYAMPSSKKLADLVGESSTSTDVMILKNHGVITLGKNLDECYKKLEVLEHTAKAQYLLGDRQDINYLSKDKMDELKNNFHC